MKTLIIFLSVFILSIDSSAQTVKILYSEKSVIPEKQLAKLSDAEKSMYASKYFALIYSKAQTIYYPISDLKDTIIRETRIIHGKEVPKSEHEYIGVTSLIVYKNYTKNLFRMELTFAGKQYSVKDKLLSFDWKITNEKKKISNYNCFKATAVVHGRKMTAWFTDELGINAGPQIYGGLPGVILFLDYDGIKEYKAQKISILKDEVKIEEPVAKVPLVSYNEYYKQVYGH